MPEEKRTTTNIRVYEETVEELRDVQTAIRKSTKVEPTYAELVERYMRIAKAQDLDKAQPAAAEPVPDASFQENREFHDMLEIVLNSRFRKAIVENLQAFSVAARLPSSENDPELIEFARQVKEAMDKIPSFRGLVLKQINPDQKDFDKAKKSKIQSQIRKAQ